jgi:plasmid stabilization system protein ParE
LAKIIYSGQAFADLERISDHVRDHGGDALAILDVLDLIDEAIGILARHPLIGRRAEADLRELIISHGRTGYVALYSHELDYDAVLVLAIRHQREAGLPDESM